jgi:hypothetical protein
MEYTYTETQIKKIELEPPVFVKYGETYWKVFDEKKVLVVKNYSFTKGIELGSMIHQSPFGNDGWEFIKEDEFNEVHQSVFDELSKFISVTM